jgi:maleylpyruvate isomerase
MVLHDYWRSSAAYRVRIALHLKGLAFRQIAVDLLAGAHRSGAYADVNPQGLVPSLEVGDQRLIQSGAILEWLEEAHPSPSLLPVALADRQIVRAMAAIVCCDIHPLNNLRVLDGLRTKFGAREAQVGAWRARWIGEGFAALETMVARHGGDFAFGAAPTLADCCLIPQLYAAERFAFDLAPYPAIRRAASCAHALPAVLAAHPDRQPHSA